MPDYYYTHMETPIGRVMLKSSSVALTSIWIMKDPQNSSQYDAMFDDDQEVFVAVKKQLTEYFEGHRRKFTVPLEPSGTPFQLRVWAELSTIEYGAKVSYGEIARRLGDPNLTRAVGTANGQNPLPIVIPCHRVVGADGKLVGYSGGLHVKKFLLDLESPELSLPLI